MRLIDADTLKEWITEHCDIELEPLLEKEVLRVIDDQNTIPTLWQWISVKDRLPDKDKSVLVHVLGSDWDEPDEYMSIDKLTQDGLWEVYYLSVDYWMPLPEPPERGKR